MKSLILQSGENVVSVFRQSKAVLFFPFLIAIFAIIIPAWFLWSQGALSTLFEIYILWCVGAALWVCNRIFLWYRETYTITTLRLVKSTHEHVFRQVVSESNLTSILNISFETSGPWSVVAGFGNVEVQVAGRLDPIRLIAIAQPGVVKEFLWRLHQNSVARSGLGHTPVFTKPNQPTSIPV